MKRVFVVLLVLAAGVQATALVGRSAAMYKPFQVFGWLNMNYSRTVKVYDWLLSNEYTTVGVTPQDNVTAEVMASVGLPGRVDVGAVLPVAWKRKGDAQAAGVGDAMFIARYGVMQSALLPVRAALALGVNVGTATRTDAPAPSLGDRTTDIGLGASVHTVKLGPVVAQGRAAYWFNGRTDAVIKTKIGNTFEYLLDVDLYATPTIIPELALSGFWTGRTEVADIAVPTTEVSQHAAHLLVIFKPLPQLAVRPKVSLPLEFASKGGGLANYGLGLDIWATLP